MPTKKSWIKLGQELKKCEGSKSIGEMYGCCMTKLEFEHEYGLIAGSWSCGQLHERKEIINLLTKARPSLEHDNGNNGIFVCSETLLCDKFTEPYDKDQGLLRRTKEEYLEIFEEANYDIIDIRDVSYGPGYTQQCMFALTPKPIFKLPSTNLMKK